MPILMRLLAVSYLWLCMMACSAADSYSLDLLPQPDPNDGQTFRVLCLHDVRDNLRESFKEFPDQFAIETRALVDIFEWLRENDFHPVSVAQILDARNGGKPLPPRPVLLTFDDGFASAYTKVFPLLKRFNYPAVFAIVTSWTDAAPGEKITLSPRVTVDRDVFLTWEQVREMAQSELVEFASHSHNLHRGVQANPQGNELPAAASRIFDPVTGTYEGDEEYRARIRADLQRSSELIEQHAGKRPRTMAWPYGAQNRDTDAVAAELGFDVMLTLQPGPNTPDVPLSQLRRSLFDYEVTMGTLASSLREPMTYQGRINPVQRIVQVDLDYIYDEDPAQQDRNLSLLLDRMKDLQPSAVYLQAFADHKGTGDVTSVYFPNRHMPVRADLFNRVAWQVKTRANTLVYAWMPVLTFSLPPDNPAHGHLVQSSGRAPGETGVGNPTRLSPFDPTARQVIKEIYEDLGKSAHFDGILFHDDAVLDNTEDASAAALATYESWGLPPDIAKIQASPELARQWAERKTRYLIDFTHELTAIIEAYQNGHDMLTVRNLYARPVLEPEAQAWYAQNLPDFLENYDYVALMAMPQMENAADPAAWMRRLVRQVAEHKGLSNTIFERQAMDWREGKPIGTETMLEQMALLRKLGAIHYGYYPDDFIKNHPNIEVLREPMSLKSTLEVRRLNKQQRAARQAVLQGDPFFATSR